MESNWSYPLECSILTPLMHYPDVKPGDLIPLGIKIYGLNVNFFMVSRLRILKQRRKSVKYTVIVWRYGRQQPIKHVTKHKLDKYMTKFNLVED
jgi:hypothetical protein